MPQPKSRLSRLPTWISYWLGYRSTVTTQPNVLPLYMICVWSFLGAFGGLAVIQAVFGHAQYFISRNVPPIVASYVRCPSKFDRGTVQGTQANMETNHYYGFL